jgi:hypothetical protein
VTDSGNVLNAKAAVERGFDHLAGWMRKAEKVWNDNSESGDMTLVERWNYHNELGSQFPPSPIRVVYAASGTNPAACILREPSVIEHKLYWSAPTTFGESRYLAAILNSETARQRSESQQSRGQWGARDFDKVVFNLPIPRFDSKIALHGEIAAAAAKAEKIAGAVALPENVKFQRARGLVRNALIDDGVAGAIDELVVRLLDGET